MSKKRKRKSSLGIQPSSYAASLLRQTERPYWERLSQVFAIVLLAIFPLMVRETGYVKITDDKFASFKAMTLAYLACAALRWAVFLSDFCMFPCGTGAEKHRTLPAPFDLRRRRGGISGALVLFPLAA